MGRHDLGEAGEMEETKIKKSEIKWKNEDTKEKSMEGGGANAATDGIHRGERKDFFKKKKKVRLELGQTQLEFPLPQYFTCGVTNVPEYPQDKVKME